MAKTLQYWGSGNFQEHPYTGRIVTWTEKEKQTVDDAIATKLLASGAGFVLDNDETGEVVTSRIYPVTGEISFVQSGTAFQIQRAIGNMPTYVAFGNSLAVKDMPGYVSNDLYQYQTSPIVWANQQLNGALYGLTNCGYSGKTSDEILSHIADVVAQKPKYAICFIPENDIATGVSTLTGGALTSTDTISNITTAVKTLLTAGIIPVIGTPLVSLSYNSQAKADHFHAVAAYIRALPYTYPGVRVFEASDLYVDLTATYP